MFALLLAALGTQSLSSTFAELQTLVESQSECITASEGQLLRRARQRGVSLHCPGRTARLNVPVRSLSVCLATVEHRIANGLLAPMKC